MITNGWLAGKTTLLSAPGFAAMLATIGRAAPATAAAGGIRGDGLERRGIYSRFTTSERAQRAQACGRCPSDHRYTIAREPQMAFPRSWPLAERAYHGPFVRPFGGAFTHLVHNRSSSQRFAPPVLASRSIPPNPTARGLRYARREKVNLPGQKVTYSLLLSWPKAPRDNK